MKRSDFYYDLPQSLIAQTPVEPRSASRMLCVDRDTGALAHRHFYDLGDYLRPGDLLVLNDSRVLPARLYGEKEGTGGFVEFLAQLGDHLPSRQEVQARGAVHVRRRTAPRGGPRGARGRRPHRAVRV